jgi:hypothetical protein
MGHRLRDCRNALIAFTITRIVLGEVSGDPLVKKVAMLGVVMLQVLTLEVITLEVVTLEVVTQAMLMLVAMV